ncbi:MAG: hypothetical protein V8Q79_05895 [Christensenellales bacterium]
MLGVAATTVGYRLDKARTLLALQTGRRSRSRMTRSFAGLFIKQPMRVSVRVDAMPSRHDAIMTATKKKKG